MKLTGLLFTLFILTITGCAQNNPENSMTISELKEKMKNDPELIILDVRTEAELNGPLGKIDGVIHIPVQELHHRMNELNEYKDREIAVICRTQNRSGVACDILSKNGFNVKKVLGGMMEYSNK